jgi:hypothetical protein
MKLLRLFLIIAIAFMALSWFSQSKAWKKTKALNTTLTGSSYSLPDKRLEKLEKKAVAARNFVKRNGYNETVCFLIDMTLPSGQSRFFIYDLKNDSVKTAGLVAHGNCF